MIRRTLLPIFLLLACAIFASLPSPAQSQGNTSPSSTAKIPDLSGKWQVAWQGRLGTEQCSLQLQQKSPSKLEGTLQDQRGSSPLSGTIEGTKFTFDVHFGRPRPFTTRFTGTLNGEKLEGTSQAINVEGGGAYLGHGGEIVQPEHPWTAKRATPPVQAAGSNSTPNSSSKN